MTSKSPSPSDRHLGLAANFTETTYTKAPTKYDPAASNLDPGFTACVIGAGQGIGEHIAYALSAAKITNLVISARRTNDLDTVANEIRSKNPNVTVHTHPVDAGDFASIGQLANFVQTTLNRLDLIIFNAGYSDPVVNKMAESDPDLVQRCYQVNAMGTFYTIKHFVPLLLNSPHGKKIFIATSSLAPLVRRGVINNMGYNVSKMAQMRILELLHEQYHADGLITLAIHPGSVPTKMAEGAPEAFKPFLVDDVGLCGAAVVWFVARLESLTWMSGRFLNAKWDFDELVAKKDLVVEKDLLKLILLAE